MPEGSPLATGPEPQRCGLVSGDLMALVETPSGKGPGDENFPVASWLLPAGLRRHVRIFYAFARAVDDIADNPALAAEEKISRLDGFAAAVSGDGAVEPGYRRAGTMRQSLSETGVTPRHCLDLTRAFKQDAVKLRYGGWAELMAYCDLSAAPVGRYLVDLHCEDRASYPASDALCRALQVLNHLQDCRDDYRALDRVYIPMDWLSEAGLGAEALGADRSAPALRRVMDRCLDGTDDLIASARCLPARLRNLRFAMEAAGIVEVAGRLSAELRRRDPLAGRVVLTRVQLAACCLRGIWRAVCARAARSFVTVRS